MTDRLLRVNAYTTCDLVEAEAVGPDGTETAPAVLNVRVPRRAPKHVHLELELDGTALEWLPPHADRLLLSAVEARTVADALRDCADGLTPVE